MLDWFTALFTLPNLGYFSLGIAAAGAWHWVKARIKRRTLILDWRYVAIPFVLGIVVYIAAQTQQNADCVREFNQVLRERSAVTSENDRLSMQQRQLIYDWIHNLVFPPPEIARLDGDDPARQRWAIDLTIETDSKFRESIEEQRRNDAIRAANPLPPPTCGR